MNLHLANKHPSESESEAEGRDRVATGIEAPFDFVHVPFSTHWVPSCANT